MDRDQTARRHRLAAAAFVGVLGLVASTWPPATADAAARRTEPAVPATAQPLPTPRPADYDATGTVSAFPTPGTLTASPNTTITFRGPGAAAASTVSVGGSRSGVHTGHVQPHPDGLGATFVPDAPFRPGETVTVTTTMAVRGATGDHFTFAIAHPAPFPDQPIPTPPPSAKKAADDLLHFTSRPDLTAPKLSVSPPQGEVAPGDVFLTPVGADTRSSIVAVDAAGQPVWIAPQAQRAFNPQVQQYRGQPVLVWYQGTVVDPGVGQGSVVIADTDYRPIAHVSALNGYAVDLHDVLLTPQGTAIFTIYNPIVVDARSVHGARKQRILEPVIQEVDVASGSLLFEWHGTSSIPLSDSYQPVPTKAADTFDYVHPNSVAVDTDGNLLVSARHTWTVYKLDRASGVLDWRLGGKQTSFTEPAAATTAWQHDAQRAADGTLTIFDNGAAGKTVTHPTRGIVLQLDESAMTAQLVRAYRAPPKIVSDSQGSFRLLPNGDYLAGWGDQPEYTEFGADGSVVSDVKFPTTKGAITSYRAVKAVWDGRPADPPAIAAKRGSGDELTVWASWNGATAVTGWTVLAGPDRSHLAPITSVPRDGFETTIHATSNQPLVEVQADGAGGAVLGTSNAVGPRS